MSEFFKLNVMDAVKGFLVAFLTVFVGSLYSALSSGTFPSWVEIQAWLPAACAAGVAYLLKNLFSNSENIPFKSEPKP